MRLLTFLLILSVARSVVCPALAEPARGRHGMVVSDSRLASEVGVRILRQGGNAVDASVAVALALAVTLPQAGNLGGGGFMLVRLQHGRTTAIDYREVAPAAATHDIYLDAAGKPVRGEGSSLVGYRAPGVPGTVAGLHYALSRYGSGRFTWAQLAEPARRLASDGYRVSPGLARDLKLYAETLRRFADSRRIFLTHPKAGDVLRQPALAATLERLQKAGPDDFYRGRMAQQIAACMRAHHGLITLADLAAYRVRERVPVRGTYRGYTIVSMPPPSSGGIVMLEILNMLELYDVTKMSASARLHLLAEAMRRAFADRSQLIADPGFVTVPVEAMLAKSYAKQRAADITLDHASTSKTVTAGRPEPQHTTHFTVVDAGGNAVANTYTLNDNFGCGAVCDGLGFLLNNEMDDFTTAPGTPNLFGLIQGEQNCVAPGKRPLSAMSPTFVLRPDGSLWLTVGSPGGPTIISAVLQVILHMIDDRMTLQQAVQAPRIHHQWLPDRIDYESMSPAMLQALQALGHKTGRRSRIGDVQAIVIDGEGFRTGVADPRFEGAAVGY